MTWEDYLERNYPTYISNAPASEPTIRMPRQSDYPVDELRQGFNPWKWLAKGAENNPVQRYLDKDETDYLREPTLMDQVRGWYAPNLAEAAATGQGNVGILPEIAGDLAGGIGFLAKAGKIIATARLSV